MYNNGGLTMGVCYDLESKTFHECRDILLAVAKRINSAEPDTSTIQLLRAVMSRLDASIVNIRERFNNGHDNGFDATILGAVQRIQDNLMIVCFVMENHTGQVNLSFSAYSYILFLSAEDLHQLGVECDLALFKDNNHHDYEISIESPLPSLRHNALVDGVGNYSATLDHSHEVLHSAMAAEWCAQSEI